MKIFLSIISLMMLLSTAKAQTVKVDPSFNSADHGFGKNNGIINGVDVQASAVQPGGKIIIGGYFGTVNDVLYYNLARLNSDGSLDTTFKVGSGPDGKV